MEKESWLEYIFGICKPDARIGKKGSRSAPPPRRRRRFGRAFASTHTRLRGGSERHMLAQPCLRAASPCVERAYGVGYAWRFSTLRRPLAVSAGSFTRNRASCKASRAQSASAQWSIPLPHACHKSMLSLRCSPTRLPCVDEQLGATTDGNRVARCHRAAAARRVSERGGTGTAVMLLTSGLLLFYTAVIVPVQICMWSYDNPCNAFPTLPFDIIVDSFFLVLASPK